MRKYHYKMVTSNGELKAALDVRRQVFINEQGIPEEIEVDGRDKEESHMVVKDGEIIIGTPRVLFLSDGQARIERMAVLKPFRGRGIGTGIVSFLNRDLRNKQVEQVFLHSQYTFIGFYKTCGFVEIGSPFLEAGIKHIKMQLQLNSKP